MKLYDSQVAYRRVDPTRSAFNVAPYLRRAGKSHGNHGK